MTKAQTLAALGNQLDSFYSLEQVIKIVESIEEGKGRVITTNDIQKAIDKVVDYIDRDQREVFDFDNAEFELSYDNRIECVGVPINTDSIREILENNFMDFGEAEEEVVGSEFEDGKVEDNEL